MEPEASGRDEESECSFTSRGQRVPLVCVCWGGRGGGPGEQQLDVGSPFPSQGWNRGCRGTRNNVSPEDRIAVW